MSDTGRIVKRFVVFVRHPLSYAYVKSTTERAKEFRIRSGRKQDLLLKVLALLGKIKIESHFYESSPRLLTPGFQETRDRRTGREKLEGKARAHLQADFPGVLLTPLKKFSCLAPPTPAKEEISVINEQRMLANLVVNPKPHVRANLTVNQIQVSEYLATLGVARYIDTDLQKRARRLDNIAKFWSETEELAARFLHGADIPTRIYNGTNQSATENLLTALVKSKWTDMSGMRFLMTLFCLSVTKRDLRLIDNPSLPERSSNGPSIFFKFKGTLFT
ncbi:hypothetical protein N7478_007720 [Penicillium angulare]|uniref:uncharacterized protein n=1 Tax=Penicillium angulare TaxID=116970 RepID=UPI0025410F98|nr:uncharacterized protein N7478_007720 [Penicillium angulare]KAJ5272595.1 hypothetical protein N7478_007720 [Penicillium angulare]